MAARKFDQNRLDQLVEAAKASERPYAALEGKRFNLSASVARTLVVGSGLSKSAPEVREREAKRIAKWLEQGAISAAKAKPKAKAAAKPAGRKTDEPAIVIPDEGAEAFTEHAERAARNRSRTKKDGQASETAKAIAASREPKAASD
jgi:hypothetical protein